MRKISLIQQIREGGSDTLYILRKELLSLKRDEAVLIFFVLIPLAYPLLYSWIYNNEVLRDVPVTVVDMDHSQMSREYIRNVDATPDVKVAFHSNSLEEARQLIGKQEVRGIIFIPSGFERHVYRQEQGHVSVYCDMVLMLAYKAIYQATLAVAANMSSTIQIARSTNVTDREDQLTVEPLHIHSEMMFNTTGGYGNAILPAVLMLILHQTLLLGVGMAAGTARENNRYEDLVPISRHYNGILRIVLGKSLCYILVYLVIGTYLGLVVPRIFGFTALNHPQVFFPFLFAYVLATTFFAMACSCLVHHRENVMLLVIFTSLPLLFLSGISWPESNLPTVWKYVAYIFPSTMGVRGFLRISSMGGSLEDIAPEYQWMWIQTFVYFICTCIVYRYQIRYAHKRSIAHVDHIRKIAAEAKARKDTATKED